MKSITLLGATGTIGDNTLDVIARHPDRYRVFAMTANHNVAKLVELCRRFKPAVAAIADASLLDKLATELHQVSPETEPLAGPDALAQVAAAGEADLVCAAIVGAAGLLPTLAAARAGKTILLANKEALVMSGRLFMDAVRDNGATLLPVDSEHNAVFQCLPVGQPDLEQAGVRRILLTASGGPFRHTPLEEFAAITPELACKHPNWVMGRKISVDSATMMNKGLEVIEARWMFGIDAEKIDVVVHPQSIVHSMVEYLDGSVLAQLGNPDMRTPIANCLAWPDRVDAGVSMLDLTQQADLQFEAPDYDRFPCLRLARQVLGASETAPAVLNAANEIAVAAFLDGHLAFVDIPGVIEATLDNVTAGNATSIDDILAYDHAARAFAEDAIHRAA